MIAIENDRQYHKDIDNKCRHGTVKQELIKDSRRHKQSDLKTGINYKPCMAIQEAAVEPGDEAIEKTVGKTKWAEKAPVICQSPICVELTGGKGHKTPVSKKCVHNPNHLKYIPLPPR